jgi:hypothetical protein
MGPGSRVFKIDVVMFAAVCGRAMPSSRWAEAQLMGWLAVPTTSPSKPAKEQLFGATMRHWRPPPRRLDAPTGRALSLVVRS